MLFDFFPIREKIDNDEMNSPRLISSRYRPDIQSITAPNIAISAFEVLLIIWVYSIFIKEIHVVKT